MEKKYRDAVQNINKILDIVDTIGEDQFRKCLWTYINNDNVPIIHNNPVIKSGFGSPKPSSQQKAILSYKKSLSLKQSK